MDRFDRLNEYERRNLSAALQARVEGFQTLIAALKPEHRKEHGHLFQKELDTTRLLWEEVDSTLD